MRHFLSAADLTRDAALGLFALAADVKQRRKAGQLSAPLAGKTCALIFEKPSLRTRVTFEVGLIQLGGRAVHLVGREIGLGTRESVPDVARNLSLWVDGIMARVYSHSTITELARHASVPVINGLSDREHPCQALAGFFQSSPRARRATSLTPAWWPRRGVWAVGSSSPRTRGRPRPAPTSSTVRSGRAWGGRPSTGSGSRPSAATRSTTRWSASPRP